MKFTTLKWEPGWIYRDEKECMGGIQGMGCLAWWGSGKGIGECACLICYMLAQTTTNGRMATVWKFFIFLSGNQSVQRFWAPGEPTRHVARCSVSWGQDRESSDFSGHQRDMGEEEESFSAKWIGVVVQWGDHPSKVHLKLKHWRALQSLLLSWQVCQTWILHKHTALQRQAQR